MEITNFEFIAPTKNNRIGILNFAVKYPISYEETDKEFSEEEGSIEFSEETTQKLRELKESIVNDLKNR